jgi:hypothetical protein
MVVPVRFIWTRLLSLQRIDATLVLFAAGSSTILANALPLTNTSPFATVTLV